MFLNIIKQEILINIKNVSGIIQSAFFFLISISIFAITANAGSDATSIAIIWICLTFSILLSSNLQFQRDFEDGTFEQLILSGEVFEVIILAKIIANWICNSLPLILVLPIIITLLGLTNLVAVNLLLVALIATIIINFLVSFGSAIAISSNQASSFITVLILPLLIPVIIFCNSAFNGDFVVSLKFLVALLIFLIPTLTFATTAAIKLNICD